MYTCLFVCVNRADLAPAAVILNTVDGQSDHLHVTFLELSAELGSSGQLRGAHRGEVPRVGEENAPAAKSKVHKTLSLFRAPTFGSAFYTRAWDPGTAILYICWCNWNWYIRDLSEVFFLPTISEEIFGKILHKAFQRRPCDHMMWVTPVRTAPICSSKTNPGSVKRPYSDGAGKGYTLTSHFSII